MPPHPLLLFSPFFFFSTAFENEENNFWGKRKEEKKINKYLKTNIAIAKLNSKIKVFSQTIWKKKFNNRDIFLCMKKCCQKYIIKKKELWLLTYVAKFYQGRNWFIYNLEKWYLFIQLYCINDIFFKLIISRVIDIFLFESLRFKQAHLFIYIVKLFFFSMHVL